MHIIKTTFIMCIACFGIFVSNSFAEPAIVIRADQQGAAFDGDGNISLVVCAALVVETNSETGVITFSCRGKGLPNSLGRAVKYDIYNNPFYWRDGIEVRCGFLGADGLLVFTNDWTETVSASGNFVFRCKVKID